MNLGDVCFHRTAHTKGSMGLCTETVKTKIPAMLHADMQRRARSIGLTDSEFLRYLIELSIHGVDRTISMHADLVRAVAGKGLELLNAPNDADLIEQLSDELKAAPVGCVAVCGVSGVRRAASDQRGLI